jgi:YbgC/YbaW family acyl-CoA thioester hydrolase
MDPNGHLNTKHFFDYIAENRMIGHREHLDLRVADLAKMPFAILTKSFAIEFLRPIFLDQSFTVRSWVESVAATSATIHAEISLPSDRVAARAQLVLVSVDKTTGKPIDWEPSFIRRFFVDA